MGVCETRSHWVRCFTPGGQWVEWMRDVWLEKLPVIWRYFKKQTRGQKLHRVRQDALLVAVQAGRCERRLERAKTDERDFTTENLSKWWNSSQRNSNRCLCVTVCTRESVCVYVMIKVLEGQAGLTICPVWSQHHNKNRNDEERSEGETAISHCWPLNWF